MSEPDRTSNSNISIQFFKEFNQIKDGHKKPLVNIYSSYADRNQPVYGTVYLMHGYGGSPIEPCMKLPMQNALKRGFDIVAIEGVALSATSGEAKKLSDMNLYRQKKALLQGIEYCLENEKLCPNYKIAWAHSMSCRALTDLMIYSEKIKNSFDELVLNNPYFLPPSKVQESKAKMLKRDPSGKTWRSLAYRSLIQSRQIEDMNFKVPTAWNLTVSDISGLANKVSKMIKDTPVKFVLGTSDDMAEYAQNVSLFNALNLSHKELVPVDGANHSFENALGMYDQTSCLILDQICAKRLGKIY